MCWRASAPAASPGFSSSPTRGRASAFLPLRASNMRPGVLVSIVGHVGAVMMTLLVWETRSVIMPASGSVVPVEIVAVAPESNVRALAEDVPDEEVAPDEQEPTEAEPAPAPSPTPQPQRRQQNDEFDLSAVAGM